MGDWSLKSARYLERAAQLRATAEDMPQGEMQEILLKSADDFECWAEEFARRVGPPQVEVKQPAVLIIEDETAIGLLLEDMLKERGYRAARAASLEKGAMLARREVFSAALLDINVQGKSIMPLARELHRQGVPCIFVSGYEADIVPPDLAHKGFFQKPFDIEEVVAAIEDCLRR